MTRSTPQSFSISIDLLMLCSTALLARAAARRCAPASRALSSGSMSSDELRDKVHPTVKGRRRFYKDVGIRPAEGEDVSGGYEITLDGRLLRTPGRRPMVLPSEALALAIAAEWDAQIGPNGIEPASMPMMSLAATALDQIALDRAAVASFCLSYLQTDTACFYADSSDQWNRDLLKRQRKHFVPLHRWVDQGFELELDGIDGLALATSDNVMGRLSHPPRSVAAITAAVGSFDEWSLASLQCATMECKSLVISMGVLMGHFSPSEAQECARIEEDFQIEQWGHVEGGHDHDLARIRVQLGSAALFAQLSCPLLGVRVKEVLATTPLPDTAVA